MRFYTQQHRYYCGIDLHARTMYLCVLNQEGGIVLHRNMPCTSESFLKAVAPYRDDVAVAVECIFTWYWLADVCAKENTPFVLGHALYMKAIHGGKAKTAKIHDTHAYYRLRSVNGIGKILALVILYEVHDIERFPTVQDFVSYCRLVKRSKESAGKHYGSLEAKIGNVHVKWSA